MIKSVNNIQHVIRSVNKGLALRWEKKQRNKRRRGKEKEETA